MASVPLPQRRRSGGGHRATQAPVDDALQRQIRHRLRFFRHWYEILASNFTVLRRIRKGSLPTDPFVISDYDVATKEFRDLLLDLEEAGLHTEVRPGYDRSILVFVKAPRQLLGNSVYKER